MKSLESKQSKGLSTNPLANPYSVRCSPNLGNTVLTFWKLRFHPGETCRRQHTVTRTHGLRHQTYSTETGRAVSSAGHTISIAERQNRNPANGWLVSKRALISIDK